MISVIIPALNEANTIASVIEFARRGPGVDEVIVIDDGSIDGTPDLAQAAGAVVVTSTFLGKGASMEEGIWAARNEVLLYLDGDLTDLPEDLIPRLTGPLINGQADFVKAKFARAAGRVTTLTARPLLRVFFPELAHFEQPLGGIIAVRRTLLRKLRFENDYGVDIGLLVDAAQIGAAIVEVDIGRIVHHSQPLAVLGAMATQVARTLLDRAGAYGRLCRTRICDIADFERNAQAELGHVLKKINGAERIALFDMDGTLLKGRFITSLARRTNQLAALAELLDNLDMPPEERTRRIAALFTGVPRELFEQTARNVPLSPGARETVVALRKTGFRVGIVTDGFHIVAEVVRRRVFADFSIAHLLRFRQAQSTGQVRLAPGMMHPHGCPHHAHCKVNVLRHFRENIGIGAERVLAVGDGENDICLLKAAGMSVAFRPKTMAVQAAAEHAVLGDLTEVLPFVCEEKRKLAG